MPRRRTPAGPAISNIRFFGYAAFNPAQAGIVQRADAQGLRLVGLYGASEVQALFSRQDENAPVADRMLGGGRPVSADARVRVRDPESGAILAHGAPGELEFFAPSSRMAGYHGNPQATGKPSPRMAITGRATWATPLPTETSCT